MKPHRAVLYAKHIIVTSRIRRPFEVARRLRNAARILANPELGLLRKEDEFIDAVLPRIISSSSRCLDVGAHIGSFSARLRELAPSGTLTLVEASPWKAAWLRKRFSDCTVISSAVSDEKGEVSFFENEELAGFSSLTNRETRGKTIEIKVHCDLLDDLLPEDAHVDFIKIDVEGHELQALRGARKLIERSRPIVLFEAGAKEDRDFEGLDHDERLFELLDDTCDYDVFSAVDYFYEREPLDLATFNRYRQYPFVAFNYFAVPRRQACSSTG